VDLNITKDSIKVTARHMSRGAWLGEMDAHGLQQCLLRFGNQVGCSGKPPLIWWIGLPTPSHHVPAIGLSCRDA
jgi:hypothetical protein